MSKILKSVTLGDVKNGGIFRALGKEFVKLDADEHGCLVLAKEIWTRMPFREGDDPECPNDLRRSEIMPYLGNCLTEFTKNGTPLSICLCTKLHHLRQHECRRSTFHYGRRLREVLRVCGTVRTRKEAHAVWHLITPQSPVTPGI